MSQIFTYDYGAPIAFYVDAQEGDLGQRVEVSVIQSSIEHANCFQQRHGGSLTSALQARIHLCSGAGAIMPPMDPNVPVLHPAWVTDSILAGRMLPVYPYLDDPAQKLLQDLSVEHRDVAELLKARVGNAADSVFGTLHQKAPHYLRLSASPLLTMINSFHITPLRCGEHCIRVRRSSSSLPWPDSYPPIKPILTTSFFPSFRSPRSPFLCAGGHWETWT
jgi:hypothetical protein